MFKSATISFSFSLLVHILNGILLVHTFVTLEEFAGAYELLKVFRFAAFGDGEPFNFRFVNNAFTHYFASTS